MRKKTLNTNLYILGKAHVILGVFMFCIGVLAAQEAPEIISLKNQLKAATSDTARAKRCSALTEEYGKTDFDSMKHYSLECLRFAQKSGIKKSIRIGYHTMGNAYLHSGTYPDSALHYYNKALGLAKELNNSRAQIAALQNISFVYINLSLYEKSLKINLEVLRLYENDKSLKGIGNAYNTISIVLCKLRRFDEALVYTAKAIANVQGNDDLLMSAYINKGVAYTGLHKFAEAENAYQDAKKLSITLGDKITYASIIMNIGINYIENKEHAKAKPIIAELTKPEMQAIQDPYSNSAVYLSMGDIYLSENDLDSALYAFNKAYEYGNSVQDLLALERAHLGLSDTYNRLGRNKEAYDNILVAYSLRDSIFNADKNRSISELKIGYEVDKKEDENKQLQQESELKDLLIKQQYIIIIGLGAVLLLIVLGGVYFYRQRRIIANQREKILEQKLLQMQLNPHFIFNSLQAIQDYIYSNNEKEASQYLSKFARLMRLTLENSRHENILLKTEIEGLENYLALQKLRMGSKLEYSITVDENTDATFLELPPMLVQPFVENAVEHGVKMKDGPGYVSVAFSMQGHMLNIKVTDNGPGFKQQETGEHQSLSAQIITERLALFGRKRKYKPELKITDLGTTQTKGTQVEINIPT